MRTDKEYGDLLLEYVAEGSLKKFFDGQMKNLKAFGGVVAGATKLIGNDVAYLVKLCLDPRLMSLKELNKLKEKRDEQKGKAMAQITKNSKELEAAWPEGRQIAMLYNPGAFFTKKALNGIGTMASPEFRENMGQYGFNQLPVVGGVFQPGWPRKSEARKNFENCWDPKDDQQKQSACMSEYMAGDHSRPAERQAGTLKKTFMGIQSLFLWGEGVDENENILEEEFLIEGEDNPIDEDPQFWALVEGWFVENLEANWPVDPAKELQTKIELEKKSVQTLEEVLTAVIALGSSTSIAEYKKGLEAVNKASGSDQLVDVAAMQQGFEELEEKLKNDKKTVEKINKALKKEKIEPTDEAIANKLNEVLLSAFKSSFLPTLKEGLGDWYNSVYSLLSQGIEPSQYKDMSTSEAGAQYVALIKEYQEKFNSLISKLGSV